MRDTALTPRISQNITISGTTSTPVNMGTCKAVRLLADADCYVQFGLSNVVASLTTSMKLASGCVEYFDIDDVVKGGNVYIAVIGTSGTINVTACN